VVAWGPGSTGDPKLTRLMPLASWALDEGSTHYKSVLASRAVTTNTSTRNSRLYGSTEAYFEVA